MAKISASALAELLELVARMLHSRGYAEDLFPAQWVALRYFAKAPAPRRTASDLACLSSRFSPVQLKPANDVSRAVMWITDGEFASNAAMRTDP